MNQERVYDYTTLNTFLSCRKKYYYRMVRHLTPKTVAAALEFGRVVHLALDLYYTQGLDKALACFRETYRDRDGEDLRTVANGVKLLETYAQVYKHEPFKVIAKPETGFVFPIGDILYGGRLDLPVDWNGDVFIMEHKTTSWLSSSFLKQFNYSYQITGYILALEEFLGSKCQGCVVNVLQPWKETVRKTARTKKPEEHFVRPIATRSHQQRELFKVNVQAIARDIAQCEASNEFYPNRSACMNFNTSCCYSELCLYGESDRVIARDFIQDEWKPYIIEEVKK